MTVGDSVFVVVLVLRISSADYLPCVLILHERSGPRSVSDLFHLQYVLFDDPCCARLPGNKLSVTFVVRLVASVSSKTARRSKIGLTTTNEVN